MNDLTYTRQREYKVKESGTKRRKVVSRYLPPIHKKHNRPTYFTKQQNTRQIIKDLERERNIQNLPSYEGSRKSGVSQAISIDKKQEQEDNQSQAWSIHSDDLKSLQNYNKMDEHLKADEKYERPNPNVRYHKQIRPTTRYTLSKPTKRSNNQKYFTEKLSKQRKTYYEKPSKIYRQLDKLAMEQWQNQHNAQNRSRNRLNMV